ncbi:hypothetical protein GCM10008097_04700 [Mycetocola manganoxydans]|nr:hypothetical protein GCM10008097_04700 [Mycetocola manganoxydans]
MGSFSGSVASVRSAFDGVNGIGSAGVTVTGFLGTVIDASPRDRDGAVEPSGSAGDGRWGVKPEGRFIRYGLAAVSEPRSWGTIR